MIQLRKITTILIILTSLVYIKTAKAEAPYIEIIDLTEYATPQELVDFYAEKWGVDKVVMHKVVKCESGFVADIQSKSTYKVGNRWGYAPGTREESYGLAQIHLPAHPNITKEQATNPHFALDFMAENISKGRGDMWTCYHNLHTL